MVEVHVPKGLRVRVPCRAPNQNKEKYMKSWHVTVMKGYTTVFTRKCLTVAEANTLLSEKKAEYPSSEYQVLKEYF